MGLFSTILQKDDRAAQAEQIMTLEQVVYQLGRIGALRLYQHTMGFENIPDDNWSASLRFSLKRSNFEIETKGHASMHAALLDLLFKVQRMMAAL